MPLINLLRGKKGYKPLGLRVFLEKQGFYPDYQPMETWVSYVRHGFLFPMEGEKLIPIGRLYSHFSYLQSPTKHKPLCYFPIDHTFPPTFPMNQMSPTRNNVLVQNRDKRA